MPYILSFCVSLLIGFSSGVAAVVDLYEFDDESQRMRYQTFVEELRCPKCQNQNLSGSNSPIASDLRREVHRLLTSGATDDEVVDFMVDRYGEYVLYKPRARGAALLLWFAPGVMLLLGAGILFWILRRRGKPAVFDGQTDAVKTTELSGQQRERLSKLLTSESADSNKGEK